MTANNKIDAMGWLRKQLEQAPDPIREALAEVIMMLMNAEADAMCGAGYGERSAERVNQRNGYRTRPWDTRVGTIALDIPKLRQGSYFPSWLLEPRRRAEQALVSVVVETYVQGVSTRKVEDPSISSFRSTCSAATRRISASVRRISCCALGSTTKRA